MSNPDLSILDLMLPPMHITGQQAPPMAKAAAAKIALFDKCSPTPTHGYGRLGLCLKPQPNPLAPPKEHVRARFPKPPLPKPKPVGKVEKIYSWKRWQIQSRLETVASRLLPYVSYTRDG